MSGVQLISQIGMAADVGGKNHQTGVQRQNRFQIGRVKAPNVDNVFRQAKIIFKGVVRCARQFAACQKPCLSKAAGRNHNPVTVRNADGVAQRVSEFHPGGRGEFGFRYGFRAARRNHKKAE